jgi:isoamylase
VIQMVTDSLRYWVEQTRVDGFRFDLGTILAREPNGFDNRSGFLKAVSQDPILNSVKLIAEPWDCGPGGYQVGAFPSRMGGVERQVPGYRARFLERGGLLLRSSPNGCALRERSFNYQGRRPWASINFITAHDGFHPQ